MENLSKLKDSDKQSGNTSNSEKHLTVEDIHSKFKKFRESNFKSPEIQLDPIDENSFSNYSKNIRKSQTFNNKSHFVKVIDLQSPLSHERANVKKSASLNNSKCYPQVGLLNKNFIKSEHLEHNIFSDSNTDGYNIEIMKKVFKNVTFQKLNRIFWIITVLWIITGLLILITIIGYPSYSQEKGYKCLSCLNSYYFDSSSQSCVGKCSNNSYWNGTTCGRNIFYQNYFYYVQLS
jgi:hypothetical protein